MKVLLRDTQTGLFYVAREQWTQLEAEAMDFRAPDRALDELSLAKLQSSEVVIHFEDTSFNIPLRIVSAG